MSFEPVQNRLLLINIKILQRWIPKTKKIWAKTNWGKLYRKLLNGCDLILDNEKYFKLTGDNVTGLLQTLNSKRQKDSKQRWWFGWPYPPKRFLMFTSTEASKLFFKTHISMNVSTKDYSLLLKSTIRMEWSAPIWFVNCSLFKCYQKMFEREKCTICSWSRLSSKGASSSSNWNHLDFTWTKGVWK
jgi:hypothetical protein